MAVWRVDSHVVTLVVHTAWDPDGAFQLHFSAQLTASSSTGSQCVQNYVCFLPSLHLPLVPSKHLFSSELAVVGSGQDLESHDLNSTHESISFCVNLDAPLESQ